MSESYEGNSIQLLEGREAVRMRPGMYIGGTHKAGLHHILWEIVDNSIDEAMNGHATTIEVTLHEDGETLTVRDDGRGIPVSPEPKTGKPAVEIVFTRLHAGAKFEKGESYKGSGGLHGVGAAVTNFLSASLEVEVRREGKVYKLAFKEGGLLDQELDEIGTYSKYARGIEGRPGTKVTFRADPEIFPKTKFDPKLVAERLEIKTYVNPGLLIRFRNLVDGEEYEYLHEDGISEFLSEILKESKSTPIHTPAILLGGEGEAGPSKDKVRYEVALQWTEDTKEEGHSFVNSIPTSDGGTHESGFRDGMFKAIRGYLDTTDLVPKKLDIKAEDIREGLKVVVNVFTEGEIQFQSQNKVKLNNPEIHPVISSGIRTELEQFLYSNSSTAEAIGKRIVASAKAREASRSVSTKVRKKARNARKLTLPGKLSDCSSNKPERCELFLVEGDSAGGNAKVARDRETQAILPLRGKVLNAENASLKSVMNNKELSGVVEALGCGVANDIDLDSLRYHKVILLMDADSDGHHIATLLLTFFYRYMPELIEAGHVYLAQPPLYKVMWGKERFWAKTENEKEKLIAKLRKKNARTNIEVSRFKGLGEMMADALRDTTLNPKTRSLIQVDIPEGEEAETEETISSLMGRDASVRHDMIVENLAEIDDLDF